MARRDRNMRPLKSTKTVSIRPDLYRQIGHEALDADLSIVEFMNRLTEWALNHPDHHQAVSTVLSSAN